MEKLVRLYYRFLPIILNVLRLAKSHIHVLIKIGLKDTVIKKCLLNNHSEVAFPEKLVARWGMVSCVSSH